MIKSKEIFDHKAIEQFKSTVLQTFLPNARYKSVSHFGQAGITRASQISLDLSDLNEINIGSNYYYSGKYSFVHYTSIPALINILKEKKIRLYSLHGMDDREEFEIPLKQLDRRLDAFNLNEIKKRIYCFSMCKVEIENNKESLPLWRSYAQDGNGVGIVFKIEKSTAKEWVHFMLSKVHYNPRASESFGRVEALYNDFRRNYDLSITNFDEIFYRYYSFHKNKIYNSEKEVRLLYSPGLERYNAPSSKFDFSRHNRKSNYMELEIEWEPNFDQDTQEYLRKFGITPKNVRPKVSIEKILLGYRLETAKWDLIEVCQPHLENFKNKPVFEDSALYPHFRDRS